MFNPSDDQVPHSQTFYDAEPPPYALSTNPVHDWQTAVPDNTRLPPPPSLGCQVSPTNNSSEGDARRGKDFCERRGLQDPMPYNAGSLQRIDRGELKLLHGTEFHGKISHVGPGAFVVKSTRSPDCCLRSDLPLYAVDAHSPFHIALNSKTIYFEVMIKGPIDQPINVAIGFISATYPHFRLPGWNLGSCGIHGDDGHRYVNNDEGGYEFTQPFQSGHHVGIGMRFKLRNGARKGPRMPQPDELAFFKDGGSDPSRAIDVEIFFTRNGKLEGAWNLHDSSDSTDDLRGLEGGHDVHAGIGCFDDAQFTVLFRREDWWYKPAEFAE